MSLSLLGPTRMVRERFTTKNMPTNNAAESGGNAGENQPQLNVVPPPEPSVKPVKSALTKEQAAAVTEVELNAKAAQQAPYAGPLEPNGITTAFLTALLADIKVVKEVGGVALAHTDSSEVATRDGRTAKKTLVTDLRQMQSSGRQLHQHTNPEKMQDYLIGQKITVNRATLKTSAQVIINKTEAERGPGIDTEFIEKSCFKCHGAEKQKGKLRLDSLEAALKGGEDGKILTAGKSADSPIVQSVARLDDDSAMPPADKGKPLTKEEVGLIRAWIDQGAK